MAAENAIIAACAHVADALMRRGAPVTWENSPFLGKEGVPWYWADMRNCASLWHTSALRELATKHSVIRVAATTLSMEICEVSTVPFAALIAVVWTLPHAVPSDEIAAAAEQRAL
mmetsp:Transcript_13601/g.33933  ORF Transcript_13601/g.33933 Transcript_13601/m.33933 type:complete len:115 (+) Transcript_13601:66-410(+)